MSEKNDYIQLAKLLDYPDKNYISQLRTIINYFQEKSPATSRFLEDFLSQLLDLSLEQIQEIQTATFDVNPICVPYVSVHLFGEESFKRSQLMAGLAMAYADEEFDSGKELADHLRNILNFAPYFKAEEWDELVSFVLLDSVEKMQGKLKQPDHVFLPLLNAILERLRQDSLIGVL